MAMEPVLQHAGVDVEHERADPAAESHTAHMASASMADSMPSPSECCDTSDCGALNDCQSCQPCSAFSGLSTSLAESLLIRRFVIPTTLNKSFVSISTLPHFRPPIRS